MKDMMLNLLQHVSLTSKRLRPLAENRTVQQITEENHREIWLASADLANLLERNLSQKSYSVALGKIFHLALTQRLRSSGDNVASLEHVATGLLDKYELALRGEGSSSVLTLLDFLAGQSANHHSFSFELFFTLALRLGVTLTDIRAQVLACCALIDLQLDNGLLEDEYDDDWDDCIDVSVVLELAESYQPDEPDYYNLLLADLRQAHLVLTGKEMRQSQEPPIELPQIEMPQGEEEGEESQETEPQEANPQETNPQFVEDPENPISTIEQAMEALSGDKETPPPMDSVLTFLERG